MKSRNPLVLCGKLKRNDFEFLEVIWFVCGGKRSRGIKKAIPVWKPRIKKEAAHLL